MLELNTSVTTIKAVALGNSEAALLADVCRHTRDAYCHAHMDAPIVFGVLSPVFGCFTHTYICVGVTVFPVPFMTTRR